MIFPDYIFIFGAKYLYLVVGVIALVWFWKLPKENKREAIIFGVIALPAIYIVSKIGAWLYFDPRPFVVGHFTPLVPHAPDNGFPSDHVLLTSAVASIIFPFSKKASTSVWIIAVLVGISRVYVGVHHPVDIIGSMAIAAAVSAGVYLYLWKKKIIQKPTKS